LSIGAYGVVLRCRNKITNKLVAIKKFHGVEGDNVDQKTIIREVRMLKYCNHINIVKLIEAFRFINKLYLVFEFCENTLLEILGLFLLYFSSVFLYEIL
jgi:cyclin-dependent kinase-like